VESCHARISELQVQLEKTRELLEETATRARADRSERDVRLMQLESEVERAKGASGTTCCLTLFFRSVCVLVPCYCVIKSHCGCARTKTVQSH
jgi:hypothetical protein